MIFNTIMPVTVDKTMGSVVESHAFFPIAYNDGTYYVTFDSPGTYYVSLTVIRIHDGSDVAFFHDEEGYTFSVTITNAETREFSDHSIPESYNILTPDDFYMNVVVLGDSSVSISRTNPNGVGG